MGKKRKEKLRRRNDYANVGKKSSFVQLQHARISHGWFDLQRPWTLTIAIKEPSINLSAYISFKANILLGVSTFDSSTRHSIMEQIISDKTGVDFQTASKYDTEREGGKLNYAKEASSSCSTDSVGRTIPLMCKTLR